MIPLPILKTGLIKFLTAALPTLIVAGALTGLITYVQGLRHDKDLLETEKTQMGQTIQMQSETITRQQNDMKLMQELRMLDGEILAGLYKDNQALAKNSAKRAEARNQLEKTNAVVKTYMDTPVPPDLVGLLNSQIAEYRVPRPADPPTGGTPDRPE